MYIAVDGTGVPMTPEEKARQTRYRRSILDFVTSDTHKLESNLGPTDRRKLDEYLSSIRQVDRQLERAEKDNSQRDPHMEKPYGLPAAGDPHGSARSRYALESAEVGADQVVEACDSVVFRGDRLDRETRVGEAIQERLDGEPVTPGVEWFRGTAVQAGITTRTGHAPQAVCTCERQRHLSPRQSSRSCLNALSTRCLALS